MPGGDRTGAYNEGPRTGKGSGYCDGKAKHGFRNCQQFDEVKHGKSFGKGRGHRHGFGFSQCQWD